MTAIILAGGKASRMNPVRDKTQKTTDDCLWQPVSNGAKGQDKAFLKIDNESLINMQIRLLKKLFGEIIIVTNLPEKYSAIRGVKVISDIIPHQGPLGGVYSGLMASDSFYNFVVACDMPYIDAGFIEYMRKKSSGYDAVVPRLNKRYEPLYSFYSKNCLKFIGQLLDKKMFRINELFSKIKVKEVTMGEVRQFALGAKIFTNINTKEDLADVYADR